MLPAERRRYGEDICVSVITILYLFATVPAVASELAPEELLLLMDASCQKYRTLSAELHSVYYVGEEDTAGNRGVMQEQDILFHWTESRSFSETHETYVQRTPDMPEAMLTKRVVTGKWTKTLKIGLAGGNPQGRPRGYIDAGRDPAELFTSPICALWDITRSGLPMDRTNIDLGRASITKEEGTGLIMLTFPLGSHETAAWTVLHIDPNRSFIPIVNEFRASDGRLLQKMTIDELQRNSEGLWVPLRYHWEDPNAQFLVRHEVGKIEVNKPLSAELLDFAFPKGTIVVDKVASLRYDTDLSIDTDPLNGMEGDLQPAASGGHMKVGDLTVRALASDKQLEEAVSREMKKEGHDLETKSRGILAPKTYNIPVLGLGITVFVVFSVWVSRRWNRTS